jgi:hypothetical protein
MPKLHANVYVRLFSQGQYLPPREDGRPTIYASLYSPSHYGSLFANEVVVDDVGNIISLAPILRQLSCDFAKILGDIAQENYLSALGGGKDLYNDFNRFFNGLSPATAVDSGARAFDIVYPTGVVVQGRNGIVDAVEIEFYFRSEDDDIAIETGPKLPTGMPGIAQIGPSDCSSEGWDVCKRVIYRVELGVLAASMGTEFFRTEGIPFVCGMKTDRVLQDAAIRQAVNLRFKRPLPPSITSYNPREGRSGTSVHLRGPNLEFIKHVTIGGVLVSFESDEAGIIAEVPPGESELLNIRVETAGGIANSYREPLVFKRHGPIHSLISRQQELRAGDVLELELACVDEVRNVQFIGGSGITGPIPGITGHEFPATWRMGPVLPREENEPHQTRLVFVTVPNDLPELVLVQVSTAGYSATTGAIIFIPGPPEIISLAQKVIDVRRGILGREIVIGGRNLQYDPRVHFGATHAPIESVSNEQIICLPPSGVKSGRIQIQTTYGITITPDDFRLSRGGVH